jgi:hypothetical protein
VTADFGSLTLAAAGPDRVAVSRVRGQPPPPTVKVATNSLGGFRNSVTVLLCGLNVEAKADLVRRQLAPVLAGVADVTDTLVRLDHPDADTEETATALLRIAVRDSDPAPVGRSFSSAAIELALASIPGFHVTAPPGDASPYGVYRPAFLPRADVHPVVVHHDGTRQPVEFPALPTADPGDAPVDPTVSTLSAGPTRRLTLGTLVGARSGDKGGDANLGVWARTEEAYGWLAGWLTVAELQRLLPETAALPVTRYTLPNLRALNFVIVGLLGEGVAASTRYDPQAKALGEWLRSRLVDVPAALVR